MTEQEAIEHARAVAREQGWAWVEPAHATFRRAWSGRGGKWEVFSNARGLGAKARVVIDAESGAILEQGYVPR
ncbi:MAG: hypothetical protein ABW217_08720 [Polyangiaceae bacterium]